MHLLSTADYKWDLTAASNFYRLDFSVMMNCTLDGDIKISPFSFKSPLSDYFNIATRNESKIQHRKLYKPCTYMYQST